MIDILPWHESALTALIQRGDKLPHALLIHGKSGIGKVEFAMALAQSLLCEAPTASGIACGACNACGWFQQSNHPDFRMLLPEAMADEESADDAAEPEAKAEAKEKKKSKEIKIDQIRAIADFMMLSTHRNGFRVLLIQPAEALNPAAANALLKTLEEPAARTLILMVSDKLGRLLATIRSRCQRVLVPSPDVAMAKNWLASQNIEHADDALAEANGGPLDAISYAERDYQTLQRAFVAALSEPKMDYVEAAQHFEKAELTTLLTWLQTFVNDIISAHMVGHISHHPRQAKAITRIAANIELARVFRFETELRKARRLINHPLNARLLLEQLLIGYRQAIKPTA